MLNSRILTGIQPTGQLHLGNLVGSVLPWLRFQSENFPASLDKTAPLASICKKPKSLIKLQENPHQPEGLFYLPTWMTESDVTPAPEELNMLFIADLHSYSTKFSNPHLFQSNNEELMEQAFREMTPSWVETQDLLTMLLACGVDPDKTTLFVQSDIPAHSELFYILNSLTPLFMLNNMIQYKTKKSKISSVALYTYPILMAADILLYNPELLPVGEDQKQHVDLTTQICTRFNKAVSMEVFRKPQLVESASSQRLMSLMDVSEKMSKSNPSERSKISLKDSPESVAIKIGKAKTDSESMVSGHPQRRELQNLLKLYSTLEGITLEDTVR
jgi:tryptophanyl-tRNA synthetase